MPSARKSVDTRYSRGWTTSMIEYKHGQRKVITPSGKYAIERPIGDSSSFGFLFSSKFGKKRVLIKQQSFDECAYCEAGLRELSVLVYLSDPQMAHPNIIRLLNAWMIHDNLYLVIPQLECSLHQYANGAPVPIQERMIILTQLISALRHLHVCGIIHRDLRAENVVMNRDCSNVCLIDFGSSRMVTPHRQTLGKYVSTFSCRAPECDTGHFSKASDVWSFGCILYELITAKSLFEDEDVSLSPEDVHAIIDSLKGTATDHEVFLLKRIFEWDPAHRLSSDHIYELHYRYILRNKPPTCDLPRISFRKIPPERRFAQIAYKYNDMVQMRKNMKDLIDSFKSRKYSLFTTVRAGGVSRHSL